MEQETQVCIFLSLLWKELIGVSEFPLAISSAGCQLIAHLLWERPSRKVRHGPSYLLPSQTLLSGSQVQWLLSLSWIFPLHEVEARETSALGWKLP